MTDDAKSRPKASSTVAAKKPASKPAVAKSQPKASGTVAAKQPTSKPAATKSQPKASSSATAKKPASKTTVAKSQPKATSTVAVKKSATKTAETPRGRILLTGANGLVGSHVAALLDPKRIRVGVRAGSSMRWLDEDSLQRVNFDLTKPGIWDEALTGCDVVVHCAGITRARSDEEFAQVNTEAVGAFARLCVKRGIKRFVLVSSLAARGPDSDTGEPTPSSSYALSKLGAEEKLAQERGGMETISLRLGGVYGPRDEDLRLLFQGATNGIFFLPPAHLVAQPIFVEDAAQAIANAAQNETLPEHAILDICQDKAYKWGEIAQIIREIVVPAPRIIHLPPIVFNLYSLGSRALAVLLNRGPRVDARRAQDMSVDVYTCDAKPATKVLGYSVTPFVEGLKKTLEWYYQEGWIDRPKGSKVQGEK